MWKTKQGAIIFNSSLPFLYFHLLPLSRFSSVYFHIFLTFFLSLSGISLPIFHIFIFSHLLFLCRPSPIYILFFTFYSPSTFSSSLFPPSLLLSFISSHQQAVRTFLWCTRPGTEHIYLSLSFLLVSLSSLSGSVLCFRLVDYQFAFGLLIRAHVEVVLQLWYPNNAKYR